MPVRITDVKAVARGVIFFALGLFVIVVGHHYPIGSPTNMGPGYFPMLVGGVLIALAGVNICLGLGRHDTIAPAPIFAVYPLVMITLGVAAFALFIERAGLVAAVAALVILVCLGGGKRRIGELIVILLVLEGVASALFVFGLGMPVAYLFGR